MIKTQSKKYFEQLAQKRVTAIAFEYIRDEDGKFPSSSYRLGVQSAPLHEVYPSYITQALRNALKHFNKRMPGYITKEALLHGVETRTSSPVQIVRDKQSLESEWVQGVYPTGEGAGYAGGIVSASVDGLRVGEIISRRWLRTGAYVENSNYNTTKLPEK